MQVTCMFYLIDATTKDVVEGGSAVAEQRPPWLGTHMSQPPFASWDVCYVLDDLHSMSKHA